MPGINFKLLVFLFSVLPVWIPAAGIFDNTDLSQPVNIEGARNISVSGRSIRGGNVPAITLTNCYNVHITKNTLEYSTAVGIYLKNCKNITIDYNYISNVSSGVYAEDSGGGIIVDHNEFKNMQGPMPRGQFVQFNNVNGPQNSISYNRCENILGQSRPEDAINLFKSNGTSASPVQIIGNRIRGGGPSKSGGGIMLGDNGGSYQLAANNVLVNPGQYGMAISGGDHISIINNTIYGRAQSFTNVGIYIWGQGGYRCNNARISGNRVHFVNVKNMENDSWIGTGERAPAGWSTNSWGAAINESVLPVHLLTR